MTPSIIQLDAHILLVNHERAHKHEELIIVENNIIIVVTIKNNVCSRRKNKTIESNYMNKQIQSNRKKTGVSQFMSLIKWLILQVSIETK